MIDINWSPGMNLEAVEKSVILQAFRFFRGNKTATSSALGIAVRTLENKLQKYKTDNEEIERANNERQKRDRDFQIRQRGGPNPQAVFYSSDAGLRMESTQNSTSKHEVPVSESKEVQSVLPKPAAQSMPRRGR